MNIFESFLKTQNRSNILSDEVRKLLHIIGWTELHQSQISAGRYCPQALYLSLRNKEDSVGAHAVLGSMLHFAMEHWRQTQDLGHIEDFWLEIIRRYSTRPVVLRGKAVSETEVYSWCQRLVLPGTFGGITLKDIVLESVSQLSTNGMSIIGQEVRLDLVDGWTHPVTFSGTIDLVCKHAFGIAILDTKSSGLWGPVLGDGASSKQLFTQDQLKTWGQLRHYNWLYSRLHQRPSIVGIMAPANLTRYQKGENKGASKGPPIFWTASGDDNDRRAWSQDLVNTITSWVKGGFYRAYPTNFGVPACQDCRYYESCVGSGWASPNTTINLAHLE